jgi:hypothetical protein
VRTTRFDDEKSEPQRHPDVVVKKTRMRAALLDRYRAEIGRDPNTIRRSEHYRKNRGGCRKSVTEFVTNNVHAVSFMLLIVGCYFILVFVPYTWVAEVSAVPALKKTKPSPRLSDLYV